MRSEETNNDVLRSYDVVAAEYARRIYDELVHKPFDRTVASTPGAFEARPASL
jgi:hypothetical protein